MSRRFLLGLTLLLAIATAAAESREPKNISLLKQELKTYVDSGHYLEDIAAVADEANTWIEQRLAAKKPSERLALVLDVDETMLSNLEEIRRNDYAYIRPNWAAWVNAARAPIIAPVLEVFRTARRHGIAVIIITGRLESERTPTEANLRALGYDGWAQLHFKADDAVGSTGAFKTAWRQRLIAEGWTIVANVGDQDSDFAGGLAEKNFKLPCPFYLTK